MAQISARTATLAKWAVVPVALLVSGLAVSQASYSAFSATTENTANNWAAGTVVLSNDAPAATAMFTATNLKPGSTGSKCITVTSSGSLASAVKLYAAAPAISTKALSDSINLTITQGTGGGFGSCTGFTPDTGVTPYSGSVTALGTAKTNFSNGFGSWAPVGTAASTGGAPETRTYQISYTLDEAAPNTTQGGTASIGFTWEAQNS